jgi:hypothetical protein
LPVEQDQTRRRVLDEAAIAHFVQHHAHPPPDPTSPRAIGPQPLCRASHQNRYRPRDDPGRTPMRAPPHGLADEQRGRPANSADNPAAWRWPWSNPPR